MLGSLNTCSPCLDQDNIILKQAGQYPLTIEWFFSWKTSIFYQTSGILSTLANA